MTIRANFAVGDFERIVGARLKYGTDLIEGIEAICEANQITSATVVSCFGSFQKCGFVYLIPADSSKIGVAYNEMIVKEGPIEFLHGTGVICQQEGKYATHFHGSMCDQYGAVFGGHFIKGENPVITVDLVLAEVKGMEFHRKHDEETGAIQFYPIEQGSKFPRTIEE